MKNRRMRLVGAVMILGLVVAACGSAKKETDTTGTGATKTDTSATSPQATLRSSLQNILGAHIVLASAATGAVLGGRTAQFEGAKAALVGVNSEAVAGAFADAYGEEVRPVVLALWRKHLGFVVDYTVGVATKDRKKQDTAVTALLAYTEEFGAAIEGLTEGKLTKAGVAALVKEHILTLKAVIDAQAAKKPGEVFPAISMAYEHMGGMAKALATTIGAQKNVAGDAASKASDLRAGLNQILGQHVAFASFTTGAALGGRTAEFEAAKGILAGQNSEDVAKAFGSVYGPDVEKAVLGLWRAHLGMFVNYTVGLATKDTAKSAKAVSDLTAYSKEFGVAVNGIIKGLPAVAVEKLVLDHVLTLKAVVDAQAKKDWTKVYTALDMAMHHMDSIASGLASGIATDKGL